MTTTTEETAPLTDDVCAVAPARALQAFADVGAALGASASVDEVLRVVARKLRELLGVERCSVFLREGDAGLFRGRLTEGGARELAPYVKRSFAGMAADGMTSELIETGRPVIVADAYNDPRMIRSNTRFWNIRSMLAVPMIFGDRVIGIVYLDDVERPHRFQPEDAELASTFARLAAVAVSHAKLRADLTGRLEVAERRVKALRRANAIDERLSELVLGGADLDVLVDAIAQLHGKPCAVYDVAHNRLAVASPADAGDRIVPRLLEEPSVSTPELAAALAAGSEGRVFVVPPMPDAGVLHRHLVAPIIVDGELWGHLVMMEHRSRLNGSDMITMRRAATLVALHAANERRAVEADWNGEASLAAELLTAGSDPETVARRAERLGVNLEAPHAVAVFATRGGAEAADFRAIASAFGELAPQLEVQATTLGQSVGALIAMPEADQAEQFATEVKDIVAAVCERVGGELVAGLSSLRSDPGEYPCAQAEAQEIVECIRRFGGGIGPAVFSTRDLGLGRVFLATADPKAVTSFASATFGSLVEDASKRDLLATLSCFFEHMASVRRCAAHLAVHENTIRYRLARIEELTGLAITHDPDAQLGARLSLLVLMLTGGLAPSDLHHGEGGARGDLKLVTATS